MKLSPYIWAVLLSLFFSLLWGYWKCSRSYLDQKKPLKMSFSEKKITWRCQHKPDRNSRNEKKLTWIEESWLEETKPIWGFYFIVNRNSPFKIMCAIRWKWNIFTFHSKNRKSKNKFSYIKKFFTTNTVKIPCRKKGLTSKIAQ